MVIDNVNFLKLKFSFDGIESNNSHILLLRSADSLVFKVQTYKVEFAATLPAGIWLL